MPNRRDFFRNIAGATAGAYAMGHGSATPTHRRPRDARYPSAASAFASSTCTPTTDMPLGDVVKGTPFEKQAGGNPGLEQRIAAMDKQGLDVQALSINGFWWYEAKDRGLARAICNAQNEGLAQWVKKYPDRFVAMASVPLQFPDLAAEILQDAVTRFGARGVTLGGHVNGEDLSLPKFDPFWAQGGRDGRAGVHAPGRRRQHHQRRRLARPRRRSATSWATRSRRPTSCRA